MLKSHLTIKNQLPELEKLAEFIDSLAVEWQLEDETRFHLNMVLEEVVSNIIFYGYDDKNQEDTIGFDLEKNGESVVITVTDRAKSFNPLQVPLPDDLDKPLEERKVGGLGILFIRTLMDDISYERAEGKNILTLTKKIK